MKTKLLLLFLTSTFVISINSQVNYEYVPFPESDAMWNEMYVPGFDSQPEEILFDKFFLTGEDTLVNEVAYKKLYFFRGNESDKSKARCIGGIREEDKKIYYITDTIFNRKPVSFNEINEEILLYDFSLNVGDVLARGNYDNATSLTVEKIDTVQIGSSYRKKFYLTYDIEWIEGIGNIEGLLYDKANQPTNGSGNTLICFKHMDEVVYLNDGFSDCMQSSITSLIITETVPFIEIYPNPVENILNVYFKSDDYSNGKTIVMISDLTGKLIMKSNFRMNEKIGLKVSSLEKGIYIISIINEGTLNYTQLFMKK